METKPNNSGSLTLIKANDKLSPYVKYIAVGEDDSLKAQLMEKSSQPHILASTPKDAAERFGNSEMFDKWQKKGRTIHWLIGNNGDLAGVIWYGDEEMPETKTQNAPNLTFAIRLYENYLGKGLSVPFMKQSLDILVRSFDDLSKFNGIWLQTDVSNKPAVAAYEKFGYVEVSKSGDRTTMVLDKSKVLDLARQ
jgi:hypothetical protein